MSAASVIECLSYFQGRHGFVSSARGIHNHPHPGHTRFQLRPAPGNDRLVPPAMLPILA